MRSMEEASELAMVCVRAIAWRSAPRCIASLHWLTPRGQLSRGVSLWQYMIILI